MTDNEQSFTVDKYGGTYSIELQPYRWFERPRWLWRAGANAVYFLRGLGGRSSSPR